MHHSTPLVTGPTALSCGQYTAKSPIGRMTEDRSQRRAEQLPRPDYSGSLATHIATGETAVVRPLLNFSAASRVRRCRLLARRPFDQIRDVIAVGFGRNPRPWSGDYIAPR